tara:strand:- start:871 stop:1140 length:270 start_codon:yes stop_codon:yes gene_type:complete
MKVINSKDIYNILESAILKNEHLKPTIGNGKDKRYIIKKGLKIRHKPTGLVYTVYDVSFGDPGDPVIHCHRPGKKFTIKKDKFKDYERQ